MIKKINDTLSIEYNNDDDKEIRRIYKIPVGEYSKKKHKKLLKELISEYSKEIECDENLGEVKINDSKDIEKDIYIPVKEPTFPDDVFISENENIDPHYWSKQGHNNKMKFVIPINKEDSNLKKWIKKIFNK